MTSHLSSQEFVNALDGALVDARQSHLDGCASCQAQVQELRTLLEDAAPGADMPEPSPLFWDHFQARVLTAVQDETAPARQAWWKNWADARTLVAVSVTIVAVVASASLYLSRPVTPGPDALTDGAELAEPSVLAEASTSLDGDEWDFVTSVMGTMKDDELHEVLTPTHDSVDAAMEALTSAERERFMKLLKAELTEGME